MSNSTGPPGLPVLGLTAAPAYPRPTGPRVAVRDTDGTHMGVAVAWWRAMVAGDTATLDTIRMSCPAPDALRSGLEVVIAQAGWLNRLQGHGTVDRVLADLADAPLVTLEHRDLCHELARQLARDIDTVNFTVTPLPVASLMDLVAYLGNTVEYRHKVPVVEQIAFYQRSVVRAEGLT